MASRVLVVDDDKHNLDLFRMLLQSDGHEVILSETAYQDMAEVEAIHPDLIILDIRLSRRLDGFDFLQKLNQYQPTKDIPIVICTAAIEFLREHKEALEEKGIPTVCKPFNIDELLEAVHQSLPSQN